MIEHVLGESVSLRLYGGHRTIGGNCVVVRDEKSGFSVMLDQGINFEGFGRYFGGYIEPQNLRDLHEVGAVPPPEAYEGVDAVFVSHLHLDHLGPMSMVEESGAELYVPHVIILSELVEAWEWSWKSLLLPAASVQELAREVGEWRGVVKPVRVSHSAYPSYAFVIQTSEGVVLYTGDFRVSSPLSVLGGEHSVDTLSSLRQALSEFGGVDLLVVEGTNVGGGKEFVDADIAVAVLNKLLANYKRGVVFMTCHPLDVESFALTADLLLRSGYKLVVFHERYARILDVALEEIGPGWELYFYDVHSSAKRHGFINIDYLGSVRTAKFTNVKPSDKVAIFLSHRAVDELRVLASQGLQLEGTLLIQLTSEPKGEESRMMEARTGAWLKKFGIHPYRVRISGHYYPHQLEDIIKTLKPKKTLPIHTKNPELMKKLLNKT